MRPLRLLLVDDSASFLEAATRFLATLPTVEVVGGARSGREAANQVAALEPDLVLMDLMMPGLNGLEATRLLKRLPEPPSVIVVSLFDDASFEAAAHNAGADGFLPKRLLPTQLLPMLEKLFAGSLVGAVD